MTTVMASQATGSDAARAAKHLLSPPFIASSASGLAVDLTVDGTASSLGPIASASGSAPPAYDKTRSVESFSKTQRLEPGSLINPTLQIHATEIVTHAVSSGFGVDAISARADVSIGSSEFLLTTNSLLPGGVLGVLGLALSASDIQSSSDASYVFGVNRSFLGGNAGFGSLRIGEP